MAKLTPHTVRGYRTLGEANAKTSKLRAKTRELISLAVAVTTHRDGCIVIHTDAASKAGATREEISEALGVAAAMSRRGAGLFHAGDARPGRKKSGRPELLSGVLKGGSMGGQPFGEQSSTPN
jgi:AhpD family alkylhydroperoxidase